MRVDVPWPSAVYDCGMRPNRGATKCGLSQRLSVSKIPSRASCVNLPAPAITPRQRELSVIRLIHIKIDPAESENAVRVWKAECAPLMIQQKGCISEKLLRCKDAPEFISYSEWDSEAAIEAYRNGAAHKEIVRHTRALKGAKAEVKLYDLVQ
jgi:heme-degrading monooxygenase HmoA